MSLLYDIKPCYFCNEDTHLSLSTDGDINESYVKCENHKCNAIGPIAKNEDMAVRVWNKAYDNHLTKQQRFELVKAALPATITAMQKYQTKMIVYQNVADFAVDIADAVLKRLKRK